MECALLCFLFYARSHPVFFRQIVMHIVELNSWKYHQLCMSTKNVLLVSHDALHTSVAAAVTTTRFWEYLVGNHSFSVILWNRQQLIYLNSFWKNDFCFGGGLVGSCPHVTFIVNSFGPALNSNSENTIRPTSPSQPPSSPSITTAITINHNAISITITITITTIITTSPSPSLSRSQSRPSSLPSQMYQKMCEPYLALTVRWGLAFVAPPQPLFALYGNGEIKWRQHGNYHSWQTFKRHCLAFAEWFGESKFVSDFRQVVVVPHDDVAFLEDSDVF